MLEALAISGYTNLNHILWIFSLLAPYPPSPRHIDPTKFCFTACNESIVFRKFIDLFEKFCGVCQVLNQILNKNTMAETTEKVAYAICFYYIIILDVVMCMKSMIDQQFGISETRALAKCSLVRYG